MFYLKKLGVDSVDMKKIREIRPCDFTIKMIEKISEVTKRDVVINNGGKEITFIC